MSEPLGNLPSMTEEQAASLENAGQIPTFIPEEGRALYTSRYPIWTVTADVVLFRVNPVDHHAFDVLLIERGEEPFKGQWALPGGHLNIDEYPMDGAVRECVEETGITPLNLTFVRMLDSPGRDPRGRVISYVYAGFVMSDAEPVAADDAANARWFPLLDLTVKQRQDLAFDHGEAIMPAIKTLKIMR